MEEEEEEEEEEERQEEEEGVEGGDSVQSAPGRGLAPRVV